jgi:hypothetical protein
MLREGHGRPESSVSKWPLCAARIAAFLTGQNVIESSRSPSRSLAGAVVFRSRLRPGRRVRS